MAKSNEIQNALGDLISAMMNGVSAEIKNTDNFKKIIEHPSILEKPNLLYSEVFYPLNQVFGEAIIQTQNFKKEYVHLAKHVYLNHQFYHWQLRAIFQEYEGSCCCADKARLVLKYFTQIAKGERPLEKEFPSNSFAVPNLNKPKIWLEYIEGLCGLHSGNVSKFLEIRGKIEMEYD